MIEKFDQIVRDYQDKIYRLSYSFYMQEKSYDEVARMLDLPIGTVKTFLFRARKSLVKELARERAMKGGTQWLAQNLKTS